MIVIQVFIAYYVLCWARYPYSSIELSKVQILIGHIQQMIQVLQRHGDLKRVECVMQGEKFSSLKHLTSTSQTFDVSESFS